MRVTSLFRRGILKDLSFADAHPLTGVTFHDDEVITNMFFVLTLSILEMLAFPFGRNVMKNESRDVTFQEGLSQRLNIC